MDVKTLCLGALTQGELSGYEIKKAFEEAFSHFFVAGYGSIYPALAELERQGLCTCRSVEQEGRPDKKVYRLTEQGRSALIAELKATEPRHKVRSEFLVLMFFAHLLPRERVAEVIDTMAERFASVVGELEGCDGVDMAPGMRFAAGYGRAVLGAAHAYLRARKEPLLRELEAFERAQDSQAAE